MADDFKNIETSLNNIKDTANEISKNIGGIKSRASSLEDALNAVEKNTKKTQSRAEDIRGDTKRINQGMERLLSKLDALNAISAWVKNDSKKSSGNGKGLKDVEALIAPIVATQANIASDTNSIAISVSEISVNTKEASEYLKALKEHIVDKSSGGAKDNGSTVTGVSNGEDTAGKSDTGITGTLKNIYAVVGEIRDLITDTKGTGDTQLDEELNKVRKDELEVRKLSTAKKLDELRYEEAISKKRKDRSKEEKDLIKKHEQKEKNKERHKKGGVGAGIARGVAKVANFATGLISEKPSASKIADKGIGAISQMGPYGAAIGGVLGLLKGLLELATKQDRASSDYARQIGGGYRGKMNAQSAVTQVIMSDKTGIFSADDTFSAITEATAAIGRTVERIGTENIKSAIMLKKMGVGAEALNNFDTFGKSFEEADKYITNLYNEVSKKGLSFKNVSKAVNDNLRAAQSHTFANGLRGLSQMAEKSTQLKYNMQQVFAFADKVSSLEGAISTSANLSVLGGEFAQYSNPMQLLYEGLNDSEALNKRLVGMFSGHAEWNSKTKQIDMNGYDRERLKQAAKAAGLNPDEMMSLALNEGKMRRIESQIGGGVGKDTAEYIKNLAYLDENGSAKININGEERLVSALTEADKKALEEEVKLKEQKDKTKLGDIWQSTISLGERLDNMLNFLKERLGQWVYKIFAKIVGAKAQREEDVRLWAMEHGVDQESALTRYNEARNERNEGWQNNMGLINAFFGPISALLYGRAKSKDSGGKFTWFGKASDSYVSKHMDEYWGSPQGSSPGGINAQIPGGQAIGPSHWDGGIPAFYRGQPWEIEGGETLINKWASKKYKSELLQIQNGTYNPYRLSNDMGRYFNPMSFNEKATVKQIRNDNNVSGTIKVDIPQTITINLAGQGKIGDYNISGIIKQYVDEFMKEAEMRKNFSGFDKERFYNRAGVI